MTYFWSSPSPFIFNILQFFDKLINLVTNSIKYGTSRIISPCKHTTIIAPLYIQQLGLVREIQL